MNIFLGLARFGRDVNLSKMTENFVKFVIIYTLTNNYLKNKAYLPHIY